MGIERITIAARIAPENVLWLEGMRQNHFPGLSRSGMLNLLLTWLRLANQAGFIRLTPEAVNVYVAANRKRFLPHAHVMAPPRGVAHSRSSAKEIA